MKNKAICMILSLSIFSSILLPNAISTVEATEKSSYDCNESFSSAYPILSNNEFEALKEQINEEAIANITPELIEEMNDILEELNENEELYSLLNSNQRSVASVSSVSLESALDKHDGMTPSEIIIVASASNTARSTAEEAYNDLGSTIEMKRDAFRHSYWNHLSTLNANQNAAKIASVNHEWVALILPDVQSFQEVVYDNYISQHGTNIGNALSFSISAAYAYAVSLRDQYIKTCKLSLPAFNTLFQKGSYIMDFWNNNVGRNYATNYPEKTWSSQFETVWNAGELIKHEGQTEITIARRIILFQSNWWYIE